MPVSIDTLLVVLHLIPQGVLAGLFFVMGIQALEGNGITLKLVYLCKDRNLVSNSEPLRRIKRQQAIWFFTALELIGFGATFAITQTIAAIGFPIIILALIPFRTFVMPKYFTAEELSILDAPTASAFTMESVGGNYGEEKEENMLPTTEERSTPRDSGNGEEAGKGSEGLMANPAIGAEQDAYRRTSFRADGATPSENIEMRTNLRKNASHPRNSSESI